MLKKRNEKAYKEYLELVKTRFKDKDVTTTLKEVDSILQCIQNEKNKFSEVYYGNLNTGFIYCNTHMLISAKAIYTVPVTIAMLASLLKTNGFLDNHKTVTKKELLNAFSIAYDHYEDFLKFYSFENMEE